MTSKALATWQSVRSDHLDQLEEAHASLKTGGAGRQWRTSQINLAMLVRLTSEFQGFARDLHDEAAGLLAVAIASGDPGRESILRAAFTRERTLDRGNPHPGGLGKDFMALGMTLWQDLAAVSPSATIWNTRLDQLVAARNAIAHDNAA